jgi:hypothetical protein
VLLAIALAAWPDTAAWLATDDGQIDHRPSRILLWLVSATFAACSALLLAAPGLVLPIVRRNWRNATAFCGSLAIALIAAEVFLRWMEGRPTLRSMEVDNVEFSYSLKLNEDGFRGPRLLREKAVSEARVFVIGDSFVFGAAVADSSTIPSIIEGTVHGSGYAHFRVVNLGRDAATPRDYVEIAERFKDYRPDAVILGLYVDNDILRDQSPPNLATWFRGLRLLRLTERAVSFAGHGCPFAWAYDFAVDSKVQHLACRGRINPYFLHRASKGDNHALYREIEIAFLKRTGTKDALLLARSIHPEVPFLLVVFPSRYQVSSRYFAGASALGFEFSESGPVSSGVQTAIIAWAASEGIEVLDLLPKFQVEEERQGGERRLYFYYDDHLTEHGNRVAAEAISSWLLSSAILTAD